ncbi:ATP-dependent metallopeptidase FtsH/Yme1/Tma family protein [Thalassiella azotivora]
MSEPRDPSRPWWRPTPLVTLSVVAALLLVTFLALRGVAERGPDVPAVTDEVTLAEVVGDLDDGAVATASVDERHQTLTVTYPDRTSATVLYPADYASDLTAAVVEAGVPLEVVPAEAPARRALARDGADGAVAVAAQVAGWSALAVALVALALLVRRRLPGGGSFRATRPTDVPTTRFADVAGAQEAVADLAELVDFLKDPDRFTRMGARVPRGALLTGPPGTGKTLLARAVAGEAGIPFFAASGADFVETFVGVGPKRVRELFARARAAGSAIVFLDEVDAVARARGAGGPDGGGNTTEHENTLVALLTELDGFDDRGAVVVLAATNRPDVLDPALTRPGRLDRRIEVPNPDRRGREQILGVHARRLPLGVIDLTALARRTPGFSGAQLAAVVDEAALEAVRRGRDLVDAECFDHAVATVAMGRARTSALVTDHDREVTAWHEAGHAVAALLLPDADDPVQVTIVPRGAAGGVTWMAGNDDVFLGRRRALAQMVVALAGRAAEEALLDGEYTQGAAGDLQSATDLALQLTTRFGMTRLGLMVRSDGVLQAGGMDEVTEVVEDLLGQALEKARELVDAHRPLLAAVAAALLDAETLTGGQVRRLAEDLAVPVPTAMPVVDAVPWRGERRPDRRRAGGGRSALPAPRRPLDDAPDREVAGVGAAAGSRVPVAAATGVAAGRGRPARAAWARPPRRSVSSWWRRVRTR